MNKLQCLVAVVAASMAHSALADTYRLTLTAPAEQWNDFEVWVGDWIWGPTFTNPAIPAGSSPMYTPGGGVPGPLSITAQAALRDGRVGFKADTATYNNGTVDILVTSTAGSWDWDDGIYEFTLDGTAIGGSRRTCTPTVVTGTRLIRDGNTIWVTAASSTPTTVAALYIASSSTIYATPADAEAAGVYGSVTPQSSSVGSSESEIYRTTSSGPYDYSKTVFADGTVSYGAVPTPGALLYLGLSALVMLGGRRR